tara:strand:- start:152 stop:565 length:414 start_codon:yes stop_codon:yes gene_type:complete
MSTKLKDLIKESWIGGFVSENSFSTEKEVDTNQFLESIKGYSNLGSSIYRQGNLKEVAEQLSTIAEHASIHTIQELEDDFDKITVGRNMKELKGYSDQFNKFAKEAHTLQQRIESLYEDMGTILNRYYHIDEIKKNK